MTDAQLAKTPRKIEVHNARGRLVIEWGDGVRAGYDNDELRRQCPCADCKGHTPAQAKVIVSEGAKIKGVQGVGSYALNLTFDDGHQTGIYTFDLLRNHMPTVPADGD